jgi:hypothetical protein
MFLSLHTLPVELVYRILDHLDDKSLFLSCTNICRRLNDIIDTYHRYQVIPSFNSFFLLSIDRLFIEHSFRMHLPVLSFVMIHFYSSTIFASFKKCDNCENASSPNTYPAQSTHRHSQRSSYRTHYKLSFCSTPSLLKSESQI